MTWSCVTQRVGNTRLVANWVRVGSFDSHWGTVLAQTVRTNALVTTFDFGSNRPLKGICYQSKY